MVSHASLRAEEGARIGAAMGLGATVGALLGGPVGALLLSAGALALSFGATPIAPHIALRREHAAVRADLTLGECLRIINARHGDRIYLDPAPLLRAGVLRDVLDGAAIGPLQIVADLRNILERATSSGEVQLVLDQAKGQLDIVLSQPSRLMLGRVCDREHGTALRNTYHSVVSGLVAFGDPQESAQCRKLFEDMFAAGAAARAQS